MLLVFTLVLSPDPLELPAPLDPPEPPELVLPVFVGPEPAVDALREEEEDVGLTGVGRAVMEQ